MNLNFFQNFIKNNTNENSQNVENAKNSEEEELELAKKIDVIEAYIIDKFEKDIAVLQNNVTKQIKNIKKENLPDEVKEGTVLKCINGRYFLAKESEEEISTRIEEKMNKLWNN